MSIDINYPSYHKDEGVVDDFFGTKIHDPFRWLEDPDSQATKDFVAAQNSLTIPYINSCPYKDSMKSTISSLWDYEKYQCIFKRGSRYFYFYNSGLQNQSVLYVMETLKGEAKVFFDPNSLCSDGLVSLNTYSFSEDGSYFAYGLSSSGSDWVSIQIKDVTTGDIFPETLKQVKFSSINWTHDNKGFFYSSYPLADSNSDGKETTSNENKKLMYHRIGQSQLEDVLCLERPEQPKWLMSAEVSDCGRYVFITFNAGCERNNLLYYCDLERIEYNISGKLNLTPILDKFEAVFNYVTNEGTKVVVHTDLDAPMYKLITLDLNNLSRENWVDLIPHDETILLEWAACVNQKYLVLCQMKDVNNRLSIHSLETGAKIKEIPTDIGSISSFSGRKRDHMFFYQFTSFLYPGVSFSYDMSKEEPAPEVIFETHIKDLDLSTFEVKQVFYQSADGTSVPMFILHRKDANLDGSSPCLLYGYGGFGISLKPFFSLSFSIFLKYFHGVAAVANIRGGGEYGEKWHSGGKKLCKQNSFNDFVAAGEFLVKNKYTSADKLIIEGGSNGGLLVSVCCNQRPDLFGAAICHVPVTDMLRFHRFTIGHAWQSDYGDVADEQIFRYLIQYSPLHNIRQPLDTDIQYPSILLLTADHDDRVVPLHSLKYIATLQEVIGRGSPSQKHPLLIRVETKAGHGAGKPTSKRIDELTDIFAFIQVALSINWEN